MTTTIIDNPELMKRTGELGRALEGYDAEPDMAELEAIEKRGVNALDDFPVQASGAHDVDGAYPEEPVQTAAQSTDMSDSKRKVLESVTLSSELDGLSDEQADGVIDDIIANCKADPKWLATNLRAQADRLICFDESRRGASDSDIARDYGLKVAQVLAHRFDMIRWARTNIGREKVNWMIAANRGAIGLTDKPDMTESMPAIAQVWEGRGKEPETYQKGQSITANQAIVLQSFYGAKDLEELTAPEAAQLVRGLAAIYVEEYISRGSNPQRRNTQAKRYIALAEGISAETLAKKEGISIGSVHSGRERMTASLLHLLNPERFQSVLHQVRAAYKVAQLALEAQMTAAPAVRSESGSGQRMYDRAEVERAQAILRDGIPNSRTAEGQSSTATSGSARGNTSGSSNGKSKYIEAQPLILLAPDDGPKQPWQEEALCAQTDPEAFFPEKGGSTREAKRICGRCDVRGDCLTFALSRDERFGIWGGLSERERRRLKRQVV